MKKFYTFDELEKTIQEETFENVRPIAEDYWAKTLIGDVFEEEQLDGIVHEAAKLVLPSYKVKDDEVFGYWHYAVYCDFEKETINDNEYLCAKNIHFDKKDIVDDDVLEDLMNDKIRVQFIIEIKKQVYLKCEEVYNDIKDNDELVQEYIFNFLHFDKNGEIVFYPVNKEVIDYYGDDYCRRVECLGANFIKNLGSVYLDSKCLK